MDEHTAEKDAPAKRPWHEVAPKDAVDLQLPHPEIQGPHNENGEECPWPWEPIQLKGAPLGQYRCPYCMAMVVAGMDHVDYGPPDEQGRSWLDQPEQDQTRVTSPGEHVHEWRGAASDPPWCACGATWPTSPGRTDDE